MLLNDYYAYIPLCSISQPVSYSHLNYIDMLTIFSFNAAVDSRKAIIARLLGQKLVIIVMPVGL